MSAANPLSSTEVSPDKRPYEPSMEEILASIRRIIADDQSLPTRIPPREPEPPASTGVAKDIRRPIPPNDPIEVAPAPKMTARADASVERSVQAPASPIAAPDPVRAHGSIAAPQFATPEGPAAASPLREPVVLRTQPASEETGPVDPHIEEDEPLYDTPIERPSVREAPVERAELFSAATDSAVSAAFNMLAASRLADNSDELMTLAREMIRPLLRTWIDDHLPSMVERMVRAEIERVARGGR